MKTYTLMYDVKRRLYVLRDSDGKETTLTADEYYFLSKVIRGEAWTV